MHANLTVITLLNISWIMSKRHIRKSKFHVCYHFLRYENHGRKTLLTCSIPNIVKQLIEIKNDIDLYFHASLWCVRKVSSF